MNLTEPIVSVVPGVTGAVLGVLGRTDEPLTGRTIASLAKPSASQRGVANALVGLVEAGVVERVDKGASALFSLNRDHVAAPAVTALAQLREEIFSRLHHEIGSWRQRPRSATVFGSFARGEGGPESDIDLLLVRPRTVTSKWSSQLADLASAARRWTGNPLNIIDVGADELARFAAEPFVTAAATDGITVFGRPLLRALREARNP